MKIPFSPPYIDEDIIQEVTSALNSGWITTGPKVKALELLTTEFTGVEESLAVNSATSGLMLALHWYGVSRGDEVIIPAYTYSATALAVMHIGATPIMVDSGTDFNMDPNLLEEKITEKTKAIIPVDIGGWPCDYQAIHEVLAKDSVRSKFVARTEEQKKLGRILVLADAAHSIGALYKAKPAICWSDLGVFSLHAVKNVTSAEGGIILMNMPEPFDNEEIYRTMRLWSLNGQTKDAFSKTQGGGWRYDIVYPGFKMNMPDVLAAIALVQLRKYAIKLMPERRRVFEKYKECFGSWEALEAPKAQEANTESSYHLYALRIKDITENQRDQIIDRVTESGIAVNVHFQPLPLLTVFKERGFNIESFPRAFDSYSREISLPIYPQLGDLEIKFIVDQIKAAYSELVL
jgi:dTDP-4-amino-4,6-dideoxygalactose transaminase